MNYNWSIGKYQTKAPCGYLNYNKDIIVDTERAPLIKKMFEMYATGCYSIRSLQQFVKDMNLCSVRSKSHEPLGRETIWNMLKNPFYYGEMRIRGEIMPHRYEPIISKALFEQVQEVLSGILVVLLREQGKLIIVLDGSDIREILNGPEDILENILKQKIDNLMTTLIA